MALEETLEVTLIGSICVRDHLHRCSLRVGSPLEENLEVALVESTGALLAELSATSCITVMDRSASRGWGL